MTEAAIEALVFAAKAGDTQAFAALIEIYERRLFWRLLSRTHNQQDAEDLSQDVWLKVAANLTQLREPGAFRGWLLRIADNAYRDLIKWRQRQRHATITLDADDLPMPSDSDYRESEYTRGLERRLHAALKKIPSRYRSALILRECYGMPYNEIGTRFHCSPGAAYVLLSRARSALRAQFAAVVG